MKAYTIREYDAFDKYGRDSDIREMTLYFQNDEAADKFCDLQNKAQCNEGLSYAFITDNNDYDNGIAHEDLRDSCAP